MTPEAGDGHGSCYPGCRVSRTGNLVTFGAHAALCWRSGASCPDGWAACLTQLGGHFFHSPPGLRLAAPPGEPIYALLQQGGRTVGLTAVVGRRCRLSRRPRHFYSPALPAVADPALRPAALQAWREHLREIGAAEVITDSYESIWGVAFPGATSPRQEYVVALASRESEIVNRCSETHRRHLRRGEREGWTLVLSVGEAAVAALREVHWHAARRAEQRGDGFRGELEVPLRDEPATPLDAPWGARTFAAWHGGALLAAVLVGWANRRAYYMLGGSTPEGYRRSAAVWLHWRVMREFAAQGYAAYNLGGTPAEAARPEDPAHGLFRFKTGFGAEVVPCGGVTWQLRPGHLRAHRIAGTMSGAWNRIRRASPGELAT